MFKSFENYLIMVGIRSLEYNLPNDKLFENIDYFKKCYNEHLSPYKSLLLLTVE